jgi:hypothetical protein
MSEIIKFEFNVPVEVALRFTEPRVFPSQFEAGDDRHMFSTTDGRVMYVTPLTSARITALHLAKGECFWICKRKNNRLTEFAVSRERMAAAPAQPAAAPRPPAPFKSKFPEEKYWNPGEVAGDPSRDQSRDQSRDPAPSLEEQLRASIDMVNRRKAATVGELGDGTLAIMAPPAPRPAAAERLAPAVAEFSSRLIMETTALVDVYAAVLRAASERHGNSVKPEDVKSFVVTAYINASKSGGRNAA